MWDLQSLLEACDKRSKAAATVASQQVDGDTCLAVWRALCRWIGAQMALKQGAHLTNLGRFTWAREPGREKATLRPAFILSEPFARTYQLVRGPQPVEGTTSEELNLMKVALKYGGGLNKDVVAVCTRLIIQCIGEAAGRGEAVRLDIGVGELRSQGRRPDVTFRAGIATVEAAAAAAELRAAPVAAPRPSPPRTRPPAGPSGPAAAASASQRLMPLRGSRRLSFHDESAEQSGGGSAGGVGVTPRPDAGPAAGPPAYAPERGPVLPPEIAKLSKVEQDFYEMEIARKQKMSAEVSQREKSYDDRKAAFDKHAMLMAVRRRQESAQYGRDLEAQIQQADARKAAERAERRGAAAAATIGHDEEPDRLASAAVKRAYRADLEGLIWAKQQVSSYFASEEKAEDAARLEQVSQQMQLVQATRVQHKADTALELQKTWGQQMAAKRMPVVVAKPVGVIPGTHRRR